MPTVRRPLRSRTGWTRRHFAYLISGCDWLFMRGDGWRDLEKLPDDLLAETVDDMSACWQAHDVANMPRTMAGLNPSNEPHWFSRYAADPQLLIAETRASKQHLKNYPHGTQCQCASCQARGPVQCESACPYCNDPQPATVAPTAADFN